MQPADPHRYRPFKASATGSLGLTVALFALLVIVSRPVATATVLAGALVGFGIVHIVRDAIGNSERPILRALEDRMFPVEFVRAQSGRDRE